MEKTVIICDHCGKETGNSRRFHVPVGTQIDPPSGRTEDITEPVDLCLEAMASLIEKNMKLLKSDILSRKKSK